MVFHFGAAGTAQQLKTANAGTPPTDVSIAENASSGQDDAFRVTDAAPDIFTVAYSDWSGATSESFGTQYEKEVSEGDLGDFEDYGRIDLTTYAYLRATGATSYSWSGSVYSSSLGGGSAATVVGSSSNNQDSTSGGTGITFRITPGSGKGGGLAWPANTNYVIFKLTGTATNSDGSTSVDLYLRYSFTA
jgi:hypothetical protein